MPIAARAEGARLHAVELDEGPEVDRAAAEEAIAQLLAALGRDVGSAHLADTPRRAADALIEMLTPTPFRATSFPNDEGYAELVVVTDIPFHSLCEHHLLPFRGVAHVGYLPGDRLIGLSKLARFVERSARDLQVQERMSRQIVDRLDAELAPRGSGVVIEAEHLCMSLRGVQVNGTRTITTATTGALADDAGWRAEFLARCGVGVGTGVSAGATTAIARKGTEHVG